MVIVIAFIRNVACMRFVASGGFGCEGNLFLYHTANLVIL